MMIGIKLDAAKKLFFDARRVENPAARAQLKMLSRFGAFVRRRAMSSIRRRKRISDPGQPPSSHTDLLKRFIFFFVEKSDRNVIIGPILLNRGNDAPRLLEHGGDAVRRRAAAQNRHRAASRLSGSLRVRYRARPFMKPAFDQEVSKSAGLLRGQVR